MVTHYQAIAVEQKFHSLCTALIPPSQGLFPWVGVEAERKATLRNFGHDFRTILEFFKGTSGSIPHNFRTERLNSF